MTGSAKTSLITHDMKFNFFATNMKTRQYTIKFHCQNEVALGSLLLLAAFPSPLAICMTIMELPPGEKVEDWVWLKSSMVLNKDLCYLLAII